MAQPVITSTVLGKRKTQEYVLRLTSSPEPSTNDLDCPTSAQPILVNGVLVEKTKKRYKCTFSSCDKAYTKPSRLAEHERSHTGERPFVCDTCNKSYLRETHLQAHIRSHLPQSDRPLACSEQSCEKRFWTSQHLRCTEENCNEAFAKQNQLRSHICTKPYICDYDGCTKSFATNQHLRTHKKTHDEKRYTCVHSSCLAASNEEPIFFSTWTALQQHMRIEHPPSCTHPSCNGRVFACQKNLREHQKLHALRDLEEQLNSAVMSGTENTDQPPLKKRRGGELGRDWKCTTDGCEKDFKSKKALKTHINVKHLGQKDFVCTQCDARYGYKRLLQHKSDESESSADEGDEHRGMDIDTITGHAYRKRAEANQQKGLRCPYPDVGQISLEKVMEGSERCDYMFTRAYDVRRHLLSVHGLEIDKETMDHWAEKRRRGGV
ncbi:transcription factor iiia [Amanita rubescens]|nr:transcription factor iiia [Amanita rubescens]